MWSSSKPIARNVSHLRRLAVANTSRPQCRASWMAAMPTPPVRGVDQHRLTGLDVGQFRETEVGGGEDDRDAGGLGVGPAGGDGKQQPRVGGDQGAGALGEQTHHAVADGEFGDVGADLDDDAGSLAAEQRVVGEHAEGDHDVAEVGGDGLHLDPDLRRAPAARRSSAPVRARGCRRCPPSVTPSRHGPSTAAAPECRRRPAAGTRAV